MGTVDQLVDLAESQVGTTSGKKYWDWYRDTYAPWLGEYVNGAITQYCAIFCTWNLVNTDTECPWFPNTYAFDTHDDLQGRMVDKYDLQRGDMVAFDWDTDGYGDHVGIVTGTYDWGVATIEGNTSGGVVAKGQRVWANINCGVRPWYSEEEDVITDEDVKRIAEACAAECATYVWGDEDKASNTNMYNAVHWSLNVAKENNELLKQQLGKLKAHSSLLESIVDAVKRVENVIMSVAKKLGE